MRQDKSLQVMDPWKRRFWLNTRRRRLLLHHLTAYLFLLPAIILFAVFAWYPIVRGFIISFQRIDLIHPPVWVGWANFQLILDDPLFLRAWVNTLYFTVLSLLFGYALPIALAIVINEMRHWRTYFRIAFYLPVILPAMVTILLWRWFYDPGPGLANTLLRALGIAPQAWLQSSQTAMIALAIQATWASAGGSMLIYLAALQGIPASLYDAAEIDGAGLVQRLRHITLPQLRRMMAMLLLIQILAAMQAFATPLVMTDGGPSYATLTVLLLLYRYAFQAQRFGAASAIGLSFFIVLGLLSLVYLWLMRRYGDE